MKMTSLIKRTIYAGLGFLGEGTDAVKDLGQELRKKADVSAIKGEQIARKIQAQSIKAARTIRQTLDAEVTKVANAIHETIREEVAVKKSKPAATVKLSLKQIVRPKPIGRKLVRA